MSTPQSLNNKEREISKNTPPIPEIVSTVSSETVEKTNIYQNAEPSNPEIAYTELSTSQPTIQSTENTAENENKPAISQINEDHTSPKKPKSKAKIALIISSALVIIAILSVSIILTFSPKELQQITTLENGSTITLKGAYIMEVPCYSYGTYEKNFDTDKNYLCFALEIKNKGSQDITLDELCSGEITNGKEKINDEIIFLREKKNDTTEQISSQAEETILMAFPVPEDENMQNWSTTLVLDNTQYRYIQGYQDVRQFVRNMYDQMCVATDIMSDITSAIADAKTIVDKIPENGGLITYVYIKQLVDNFYDDLSNMQQRNNNLISSLNELNPPDIPFYQQTRQDLIDDANERIDKLEPINDIDYPTNINNLSENSDALVNVVNNFPNAGLSDMLTMGQHFLVDFNAS